MNFWANVNTELDFQGMTRKELAYLVDIKEMTIHKAIERNSIPSADTALRIAKVLNVSLETLLDLPNDGQHSIRKESPVHNQMEKKFKKYSSLINQLEKLSQKEQKAVLQLVETLAK